MIKMKKIAAFSLIYLFSSTPNIVLADAFNTEASATVATQYLWRGFDLSQEDPAIQGDFIVNHESGFWIGAWATTYDVGSDDGVEIDYIGGYNYALNDSVTLGAGFTEYTFTGDTDSSTEFFVQAAVNQFTFTYYEDVDIDATYITLDAEFALAEKLTLNLHAGDYSLDAGESNNEYNVAISYAFNDKLSFTALYSDNSLDTDGAKDYFVASASYTF